MPVKPPIPDPLPLPPPQEKNTTPYEILLRYGLLAGLSPSSVTVFLLADDGNLTVNLAGPCSVHFEYLTVFDVRVTGVLRYGSLTDLQGV